MSSFKKVRQQTANLLFLHGVASLLISLLSAVLLYYAFELSFAVILSIAFGIGMVVNLISSSILERTIIQPFLYLAQSIEHIVSSQPLSEKKIEAGRYGHDIVKHVVTTVANFMQTVEQSTDQVQGRADLAMSALHSISIPILALDNQQRIVLANQAAAELLSESPETIEGKLVYEAAPLSIAGSSFLDKWITDAQSRIVNEEKMWEEVNYTSQNRVTYNFDVYMHFVRNQKEGVESVLALVDRTNERAYDDLKVDFAAMAAHELRAPITVIRGYVDVFEDELMPKLDEEQKGFMQKLKVSATQLSGFINNVLNVAQVDRGELQVSLEKGDWEQILTEAINDLQLRAQAHGKFIDLGIDKNLPPIAVDPISITEVVNNLVDNAIKYSNEGDTITVRSQLLDNGMVETTVYDTGVGIPANLMDKLFTKFYRSHRTRRDFTGSGLGLFLCKAIIDAHHGDIWAKSKEGFGSTFGFNLPQYDAVDGGGKSSGVNRGKHGWIKNHTLYRQ